MKIKETKILQSQRLKEICNEKGVNFNSIETLLDSVKTKKLLLPTLEFLETFACASVYQPIMIGLESKSSSLIGLETGWYTVYIKMDSFVLT